MICHTFHVIKYILSLYKLHVEEIAENSRNTLLNTLKWKIEERIIQYNSYTSFKNPYKVVPSIALYCRSI